MDTVRGRKASFYTDRDQKPALPPPDWDAIPTALRAAIRWVLWRLVWRANADGKGKWDKVPFQTSGKAAKPNDATTWTNFEKVKAAYKPEKYDGIGFMLGGGFAGVDLDDAIDSETGELATWANDIVRQFNTYCELSPSATGVKLIGHGLWTGDRHRWKHETGEIEVYSEKRYFTITGVLVGETTKVANIQTALDELAGETHKPDDIPPPPRAPGAGGSALSDDEELIRKAMAAKNGDKFRRLWAGDTSGHGKDDSAADLALCDMLAFWCGPDPASIDRLFRQSGLMRPKWDEKRGATTYGERTIGKALAGRTEFYNPHRAGATFSGRETAGTGSRYNGATQFTPELIRASDVTPVSVPWGWPGRIPLGRGTLVAGRPGVGKTGLLCEIAATFTRGRHWPDGSRAPLGDVLILSAEDDPADTLVPRLQVAGADLDRVHFLKGAWAKSADGKTVRKGIDLQAGLPLIEEAASRLPDLKLLFIDPIGSYMGRGVDAHRDNDVRNALEGVNRLASERGFALVLIAHVNKSSLNQFADDSVLGSRAFTGIVRAVHHLLRDPDNKDRLFFTPGKCNLSITPTTLAYTLEPVTLPTGEYPRVVWDPDPVDATADDFIGTSARRPASGGGNGGRNGSERAEAEEFLLLMLADGPKRVPDLKKASNAAGHSWGTVKRAKDSAGITGKPRGGKFVAGQPPEYWWGLGDDWEFPPEPEETAQAPTDDPTPTSQAGEPTRGEVEGETEKAPEIIEEAQPDEGCEPPRTKRPKKPRRGSQPPPVEPAGKRRGKRRKSSEEAHNPGESGATPPPDDQ